MSAGWIGVDLDGTLARYDGWVAADAIGDPIWPMVDRVRAWLAEGKRVKIFTARANIPMDAGDPLTRTLEVIAARTAIRKWCLKYLGRELEITCTKDLSMIELWDDRAVQVEINTGRRVDGRP